METIGHTCWVVCNRDDLHRFQRMVASRRATIGFRSPDEDEASRHTVLEGPADQAVFKSSD
jgi:hypothetical protein